MIQNVLVLGAGSAGLIAALTLQRKLPQFTVRVLRSKEIGVIGVGEGTTPSFPHLLLHTLQIPPSVFHAMAQPTWKTGIRFLWGPRGRFDYTFAAQLDTQWSDLSRPTGFYCDTNFRGVNLEAALIQQDKAFLRQPNGGGPEISSWNYGFHVENRKLVDVLEVLALEAGVEIIDGTMTSAERGPEGISAIDLEDGRRLTADLFIDASGFRSELLGKTLQEPFISFDRSLFCDRAVVGGWDRTVESILPYTTAETMDAGWSWQIEHEHFINRGYVFCSQAISDEQAIEEYRRKFSKAPKDLRVVKFRSGYYRRAWVDNVLAIGNACGFVEPLEATALMVICKQVLNFVVKLEHCSLTATATMRKLYNDMMACGWEEIRDFLGLHYKLNTLLDTPFWKQCQEDTPLGGLGDLLEFYAENGPTGLARYTLPKGYDQFGIEGYLVMLVGCRTPYRAKFEPTVQELGTWKRHQADLASQARAGMSVRECLDAVRHPHWRWAAESQMKAPVRENLTAAVVG